jgi:hypothetical protein
MVHAVASAVLKPLPEIDIKAPGLAVEGLSVIEGVKSVTVKVAATEP